MADNFERCLALVLKHEGKDSNHKDDPGGPTSKGVIQKTYDAYRKRQRLPRQAVSKITMDEVHDIYRRQYWNAVQADSLPAGLDYVVFDYAVNSGVGRAAMDFQRVLKVKVDGHIGEVTIEASDESDHRDIIERLSARRLAFLKGLRTWRSFGKGWTRRVNDVRRTSSSMVEQDGYEPEDDDESDDWSSGKGMDEPKTFAGSTTGKGAATSAVGLIGGTLSDAADKVSDFADYSEYLRIAFIGLLVLGIGLTTWGVYKGTDE